MIWASLVAQSIKNSPAMWETWVRSLGWEEPLEKGKATHSSMLVWRISWMDCIVHGVAKNQTLLSNFHFHCLDDGFSLFSGLCLNVIFLGKISRTPPPL